MYYSDDFRKALICLCDELINDNVSVHKILLIIKKSFFIKKSTYYEWRKNLNINNIILKRKYINKKITSVIELFIVNNFSLLKNNGNNMKNIIKKIKKCINDDFHISISDDAILYVFYANNLKSKNNDIVNYIKKNKSTTYDYIVLTEEQNKFIIDNYKLNVKNIKKDFNDKFKLNISGSQIINILHQNKLVSNSKYYKLSQHIETYMINSIKKNPTITAKDIKKNILTEYQMTISLQFIYNVLKKNGYTYKKFKICNNQYPIDEQVSQFKKIVETHKTENINNCISIDEISFILESMPDRGWFGKGIEPSIQSNSKKIIRKRYTILMACSNEKIIHYCLCEKGMKQDDFINFMKDLKGLDPNNKKYYLLDNARIHKGKKFSKYKDENKMEIVYNAPYHSETNPIENVFSILRNYINRNENKTEETLKKSINEFIKLDNKEKFKNIFNHSVKMMNDFIKKNEVKKETKP
jgi:transposase